MKNEAILLIPGLDSQEIGYSIDRLVDRISKKQLICDVKISIDPTGNRKNLELTFNDSGKQKTINIYEVFWADIIDKNHVDGLPLWKKVVFGLELIQFWIFSSIWIAARKNKWLLLGMVLSGLVLIGWYLSILGLVITAFYNSDKITDIFGFEATIPPVIPEISFVLGVILGLVPTTLILKASGFSMKYLKSNLIREEIRARISTKMSLLRASDKNYERITLLSHSMGAVAALDYLANLENKNDAVIRSISLGASISFLSKKSEHIRANIQKCIKNGNIDEWTDFYSQEDWLCAYENIEKYGKNFNSNELKMDSNWLTRFGGKVHKQYFDHSKVIEKIIRN